MQRIIFCLICALLLVKPTSNSLFLSILGIDSLPFAYITVSAIALIISLFYNKHIDIVAPKKLFIISSLVSAMLLVAIAYCLYYNFFQDTVVFAFYLFVSVFGILSASQFWILFNQIFNARQARKYFGVIGSGAIAGGIVGGYLATIITAITSSEFVLIAAAIFILTAVFEVTKLKKEGLNSLKNREANNDPKASILRPFFLIKSTRHLKLFALLVTVSVFVAKLIDYQFGYFASQAFTTEDELTAFYGFWYSSFNLVALIIQLFITNKIVGRFGVAHSILILPVLVLMGSVLLLILPVLMFALTIKLLDASLKQSINKASFELIMLPIPEDIKLKTKTFIDLFIDSLATGISGLAIIFIINALNLPNYVITIIIIAAGFVWYYYANVIRKEYKEVFRNSLKLKSDHGVISNKNLLEQYEEVLSSGNDFQILKTLKILKSTDFKINSTIVNNLLNNQNPKIVIAIIHQILFENSDYATEVKALLNHPISEVKSAAFEYLINHQDHLETHFLLKYLESKDYDQLIMALSAYSKEFGNNITILKVLDIEKRIQLLIDEYRKDSNILKPYHLTGIVNSIASCKFESLYYFIEELIYHQDKEIRGFAILEAGVTGSENFLKILSSLLSNPEYDEQEEIYIALAKYGLKELYVLENQLSVSGDYLSLRKIPYIYSKIAKQEAITRLEGLLKHKDLVIRNNSIHAMSELLNKYPLLKTNSSALSLLLIEESKYNNAIVKVLIEFDEKQKTDKSPHELINVLKSKIDSNLKVIFSLLDMIYPPEDYLQLYEYVKGSDEDLRNNAIEYVDNSLQPNLKNIIIPLIEYHFNESSYSIDDIKIQEYEMRSFLIENRDEEIRKAANKFFN